MTVFALNENKLVFPSPRLADESGLLAIGGKLDPNWILKAYSSGIFPWFNFDDPIMWWSPNPRSVITPGKLKISKSMRPYFRSNKFELRIDTVFDKVISNCQQISRADQSGTWITPEMQEVYIELHNLGYAHSFESWQNDELVGGLYGLSIGKVFFGESMFAQVSNASKFALISLSMILKENNFSLLDCQIPNPHLTSMGCQEMSRDEYLKIISQNQQEETIVGNWNNGVIKVDFEIK